MFVRMLTMEMEVRKPTHVAYLLLIFWHRFCIPNAFSSLGIDPELAHTVSRLRLA